MSDTAESLFADALATVQRECPEAHRALTLALGAQIIAMTVGDENFVVSVNPPTTESLENPVAIRTSAALLHAVVSGSVDVTDAIYDDRLFIVGDAAVLSAAADAALFFVKGAVRCTSLTPLLLRLEHLSDREGLI